MTPPAGGRPDRARAAARRRARAGPAGPAGARAPRAGPRAPRLARLASVGVVLIVPHRGVFVADVSTEELEDLYSVREVLEEQAARIAVDRLTEEDFATLDRLAEEMATAARAGDLDSVLKHNRELHFTLYRAAKRRHMLQIVEQLWDLSARYPLLQLH